jgi:hypothetical protein
LAREGDLEGWSAAVFEGIAEGAQAEVHQTEGVGDWGEGKANGAIGSEIGVKAGFSGKDFS